MKFGIVLLLIGLIIAGIGIYLWQYGSSNAYLGYPMFGELPGVQQARKDLSAGLALMAVGGGFAIGGIVWMIKSRNN